MRMDDSPKSRPLCWTEVYVDAAFSDIERLVCDSPDTLISTLIEKHYGRAITRIKQEIDAISIPPHLTDVLLAEAGTPALRIIRRYFDASGELLEISRSIHPANRFRFSMEMNRSLE